MKYIFLDIDGVLNNESYFIEISQRNEFFNQIDSSNVKHLAHIFNDDPKNTKIILSSSWRHMNPNDGRYLTLINKLKEKGMHIFDKTKSFSSLYSGLSINCEWSRDLEILDYINNHLKEKDKFVIIDDENIDSYKLLKNHFIQTSFKTGLTKRDAQKAIEILNDDKKLNYMNK